MKLSKSYRRCRFTPEVLQAGKNQLLSYFVPGPRNEKEGYRFEVVVDGEDWEHEDEAEFVADYRRSTGRAVYQVSASPFPLSLIVLVDRQGTEVTVEAASRNELHAVFQHFDAAVAASVVPAPPAEKPRVFIGHGGASDWRALKDHLHDQHGIDVEAYEIGARAGHVIRDILDDMLKASDFALLVLTGEDENAAGEKLARQNVVHETGLFQGRLGWSRAIVLLEEGTEEFSNIAGIHQIRFGKGRIRETFGDVLATLKREFPGAV